MERAVGVLVLFLMGCGGSGGGDGPPQPPITTGGGGGSGGASSGGGSGGSSGSDGGSAGTSVGGASGAGGSGAPVLGPGCPTDAEAVLVWSKLAGTHPMEAMFVDTGTDAYWTLHETYDVVVDTTDCSVIFHTKDNGTQICKWTGAQYINYASETVDGITYTIHIQDVLDQNESDSNLCELNYRIDLDKMGISAFFLPHTDQGAAFDSPGGTPDP